MRSFLAGLLLLATLSPAQAAVCDYRLSSLFGSKAGAVAAGLPLAPAAGHATMAIGGLYFFPHATAGMMLGSTAAGASAAGTVGIIANSGIAASVLGVLTAPLTLAIAGLSGLLVGVSEAGCYFVDERITDEAEVLAILRNVASQSDEEVFKLFDVSPDQALQDGTKSRIRVPDAEGNPHFYFVSNLYIVNGALMHRDYGPNTNLGSIVMAVVQLEETIEVSR